MARMKRVVAAGLPHHVTQRGNQRRDVFLNDVLKQVYLDLLRQQASDYGLQILAYCLMTNHLHLVVIPGHERSLSGALRHTHGRFAQYWNTALKQVGHMWQDRYYSCPMEPAQVWPVVRYVELNPVRAGMVGKATDYRWSSAAAHTGGSDPNGLLDLEWWRENWGSGNWSETLRGDETGSAVNEIRRATYTGRPLGGAEFIAGLERQLGRRLARQRGGRPKKAAEDARQLRLGL